FGLAISPMADSDPAVESVQIEGPYAPSGPGDSLSRQKIFQCRPTGDADEARCARAILATLARRAYRRPVTEADLQPLVAVYTEARRDTSFESGIEQVLRRILLSPEFLFRIERDPAALPAGTFHRLSDVELASRLSFFLWTTMPDEELLEVAERGQ